MVYKNKMLVIHHNDADGRSAAYGVKRFTKSKSITYLETNYTDLEEKLKDTKIDKDTTVFIVDVSFTPKTIASLYFIKLHAGSVIWIDHHDSSIELIKDKKLDSMMTGGIISKRRSGAYLVFLWFLSKGKITNDNFDEMEKMYYQEIPLFIKYIDDHDRFKNTMPESNWLKFSIMGQEDQSPESTLWDDLYTSSSYGNKEFIRNLLQNGKIIEDYMEVLNNTNFKKYGYESEICGIKCIVFNGTGDSYLLNGELKNYPCGIIWTFSKGTYKYSIYSDEESDIDCYKIAKSLGGGGHIHASGFTSKELLLK